MHNYIDAINIFRIVLSCLIFQSVDANKLYVQTLGLGRGLNDEKKAPS